MEYEAILISDVHLGTYVSKSIELLEYLKSRKFKYLILVGDFIDFQALNYGSKFSKKHSEVIQYLFKLVKHGVKIIYIVGNHDNILHKYSEVNIEGVTICEKYNYGGALIVHGDQFEPKFNKLLVAIGDIIYESKLLPEKLKRYFGRTYIKKFEAQAIRYGRWRGVDTIICGHIHVPKIIEDGNEVTYINCGDWVSNCTAVVYDGIVFKLEKYVKNKQV